MSFNVNYSFNNGATTGTANNINELYNAIQNFNGYTGQYPAVGNLLQCTLSGTAEGELTGSHPMWGSIGIFVDCLKLTSIDVSELDVSDVTDMSGLFYECELLDEIIGIENWNTINVTTMNNMFYGCKQLTSLNLYNFDMSNMTNTAAMFSSCENLEHIYVGKNWELDGITGGWTSGMFDGCIKLPNYDSSKTDRTMAYIGGYFEQGSAPTPAEPTKLITGLKFKNDENTYVIADAQAREDIEELRTKFTVVTQAEYDALTAKDSNTLYFIKAGD